MHFVAPGSSIFHGQHQTITKAFDNKRNNRVDSKWQMKESEVAATEGEEGWRRCSRRTVTHPHGQQHQYMYVIYRERRAHAISGRSALQVHLFQVLMFHRRKWKRLSFSAYNVILMENGFHHSSTVFFHKISLLSFKSLHLSLSLIFRREVDTARMINNLHAAPSSLPFSNCLNSLPPSFP